MAQEFYYVALAITSIFALISLGLMGAMMRIYINVTRNFQVIDRKDRGRKINKND